MKMKLLTITAPFSAELPTLQEIEAWEAEQLRDNAQATADYLMGMGMPPQDEFATDHADFWAAVVDLSTGYAS